MSKQSEKLRHLRSCRRPWARTRWGTRWWCSSPPGWFSPPLRLPPARTSPASPPPRPRSAASGRSPGTSAAGRAERGSAAPRTCSLRRPAEASGTGRRATWGSVAARGGLLHMVHSSVAICRVTGRFVSGLRGLSPLTASF